MVAGIVLEALGFGLSQRRKDGKPAIGIAFAEAQGKAEIAFGIEGFERWPVGCLGQAESEAHSVRAVSPKGLNLCIAEQALACHGKGGGKGFVHVHPEGEADATLEVEAKAYGNAGKAAPQAFRQGKAGKGKGKGKGM